MKSKQTRYPIEFKKQIIKEVNETGNATLVARKHDLVAGTVNRWVKESKSNKSSIRPAYSSNIGVNIIEKENEQLKKLLGEKDLEIAILRDLLKKTNPQ